VIRIGIAALVGACIVACGPRKTELPPLGEVLVVVDTDMPVPRIVSRLRVDFYTAADHVWYGSRDVSRGKSSDFPTSFGVYVPDAVHEREVLVRLRAYPQGESRDYRGERLVVRPSPAAPPTEATPTPPPTDEPRLRADDGSDATPPTEPKPEVTIDRLIRVSVAPNERASVRVLLRGACVGTMADLAREQSCVDTEAVRAGVEAAPKSPDLSLPSTSLAGSFDFAERCTAPTRPAGPLHDDEVCVDGALFLFGSDYAFGSAAGEGATKHVAILPAFRIDKYEVTVARWRAALAQGFTAVDDTPLANDTPIPTEGTDVTDPRSCTWSTAPLGREDYPLTCLSFAAARAFCRWAGGDLPTEAQWEYVAMHAGRPAATPFAWGGVPGVAATCDQAFFGRGALPFNNECNKDAAHFGAGPVTADDTSDGDVSLGLKVVGLTASVAEMTLDAFASMGSNCWNAQPLHSPACLTPSTVLSARGASWSVPHTSVFVGRRLPIESTLVSAETGLRCVRPGT
jgi:formylglycine-generating enzyme required for sulfatase activity